MKQYLDILNRILTEGTEKGDRTAPSQVDHLRTALVPERRHKRKIPARAWRTHLERMG